MTRIDEEILRVDNLCRLVVERFEDDPEDELVNHAHRVLAGLPTLRKAHLDGRSLEHIRIASENLKALGAHLNLLQIPKTQEG